MILAIATLAAFCATHLSLPQRIDFALRDALMRFSTTHTPEPRLAVVDIDEASIAVRGPWPWPRAQIADLVELLLEKYAARAVGIDILFPSAADADGDSRLAVLAEHAPVALAVAFDFVERPSPLRYGVTAASQPANEQPAVPATGYVGNQPRLAKARCVGNISFLPDSDGTLRRLPARVRFEGKDHLPFSVVLASCAAAMRLTEIEQIGQADGFWRIPFKRKLEAYTVIPAWKVFSGRVPPELLMGRIVLIGSSALGLSDRVSIPLANSVSGVMVHAEALSSLLDPPPLSVIKPWLPRFITIIWLALSLLLIWYILPRKTPWTILASLVTLSLGWVGLAWLFSLFLAEIPLSAPIIAYLSLLTLALPYEWWRQRQKSQQLVETFSHYVAPEVLAELLQRPNFEPLAPALHEITVLIADMQGYSRLTNTLSLEQAARLTKELLECLTQPILATQGTLDRYTGDGLVAFWGAPIPINDHADRALDTALKIKAAVAEFNLSRAKQGLLPIRVRIGIESGSALVGDLGTHFRSTYTAVGDCINFAAKLEQAAHRLPVDIIIGPEASVRLSRSQRKIRPLGTIELNGISLSCWTVTD